MFLKGVSIIMVFVCFSLKFVVYVYKLYRHILTISVKFSRIINRINQSVIAVLVMFMFGAGTMILSSNQRRD